MWHFLSSVLQSVFHSFIHSIDMCRMWRFLAFLCSFFHSSLFYNLSFHPFPPTRVLSSLLHLANYFLVYLSSCCIQIHINKTFLGVLFSSILSTCPNYRNLFNFIVSDIIGFLTTAYITLLVNIFQFSFYFSYIMPKILLYTFLSKVVICFLCLFVNIQVSDAYIQVKSSIVFFSLNFSFLDMF